MALKYSFILVLLALALVADLSAIVAATGAHFDVAPFTRKTCDGQFGECSDQVDEDDTSAARRSLINRAAFISYGALSRNKAPCGTRGASYYKCRKITRVNPYSRGCLKITHCQRDMRTGF